MAADKILTLVNKVNQQLQDDQFTRWPKEELIGYFNDAQLSVIQNRPDAYTKDADIVCAAGTKQALPSEAIRLIDIRYNSATMRAITFRPRAEITEYDPMWYGTTGEDEAESFFYDERDPKVFFLYPGVADRIAVAAVYSVAPDRKLSANVDDTTDADLDSIYSNAIVEYMLYLAHTKDFEYSEQAKAQTHLQAYMALLNIKSQSDVGMTPTDKE